MNSGDRRTVGVRVLVAGAGQFGREHLARLVRCAEARVVGVAEARDAALAQTCAQFGVEHGATDVSRLIAETPADALIVATPAPSHVEISQRALAAGLCVLLEKPVALSAAQAARLIEAERGSRGFLLPGHVLRFSRDHRKLVEWVREGRIGDLLYVNSRRYRDDSHAEIYPNDDPLLMTLVHDIDLAQWVTGAGFARVLARRSAGPGFRTLTAISATTPAGVICELRTAWTFPGAEAPADRLEAVGTRGSVELTVGEGLRLYCEGRRTEVPAQADDDPLTNEHAHFLARVADRTLAPALGLAEAIEGLKLADAAMQSLRLGREVEV